MSRAYDAQQAVLKAHPNDIESAVDLFMLIIDMSQDDFEYEFNESPEKYIFGDEVQE